MILSHIAIYYTSIHRTQTYLSVNGRVFVGQPSNYKNLNYVFTLWSS